MFKIIKYVSAAISIVCYAGSFFLATNSGLPDWEIVQDIQSTGVQILRNAGIFMAITSVIAFILDHYFGDNI